MRLGERVRALREAEGMGRQAFCEITGLNKQTLINIETGKRPQFAALELEKIAVKFPEYSEFLLLDKTDGDIKVKLENLYYRK